MKTITVLGAIIENDGKILLARRAPGQAMAGKWEFPGGKLEEGETDEECLKREMLEEMKAHIEVLGFFAEADHTVPGDKVIHLKCYMVRLLSRELQPVDHDKIEWVEPEELLYYDLTPADVAVAKKIVAEH